MPFGGLRVVSLESRRAKDMETLILREGGVPFVAPSVKEEASDGSGPIAVRFVEQLEAGEFDMLICMTGVGLTVLRDACAAVMPLERLTAALRRVSIVSRGPKPVGVLRSLDVPVHLIIPEPNTWRELVEAVRNRPERRIAVQEYGRLNTATAFRSSATRCPGNCNRPLPLGAAGRPRPTSQSCCADSGQWLRCRSVHLFGATRSPASDCPRDGSRSRCSGRAQASAGGGLDRPGDERCSECGRHFSGRYPPPSQNVVAGKSSRRRSVSSAGRQSRLTPVEVHNKQVGSRSESKFPAVS